MTRYLRIATEEFDANFAAVSVAAEVIESDRSV